MVAVSDDVDLLAAEFDNDALEPAATDSDAGPHAIDFHVVRDDGNLGAAAGLPGKLWDCRSKNPD